MCFLWGTQDSGINCFINCILGFEFESKILPFSVFKFTQSLFTFVFFIVHSHLVKDCSIADPDDSNVLTADQDCIDQQITALKYYLMGVGIFGLLAVAAMIPFDFKEKAKEKPESVISKVDSEYP
jgi:hypothetical protein